MTSKKQVLVVGDVTNDVNIYHKHGFSPGMSTWNWVDLKHVERKNGGACLLKDLIAKSSERIDVLDIEVPEDLPESYALWTPHRKDTTKGTEQVWRLKEFLGKDIGKKSSFSKLPFNNGHIDLLVIDDGKLNFRKEEGIKSLLNAADLILLKTVHPFKGNKLLNDINDAVGNKLIVILPADHLRLAAVQISRSLSWEQTARDILKVLSEPTNELIPLTKCRAIIITFETTGALIYFPKDHSSSRLIYDPTCIEGTWGQQHPGKVIAYATCITAAMASKLAELITFDDVGNALEHGIMAGVAAARKLLENGHGEIDGEEAPGFPGTKIAEVIEMYKDEESLPYLASVELSDEVLAADWSIAPEYDQKIGLNIVTFGVETALPEAPVGRFRNLLSIDPEETAQFRALRNLFEEYCKQDVQRPLSVAVFGSPGSGKSFAVKEIAQAAAPEKIKTILEFNLSQLADPEEILKALHQVRDVALKGTVPLVFWDEFDTSLAGQELGWLRYFLAPMQDGQFQQGEISHPIGKAIFVFAGGTAKSYKEFHKRWCEEENKANFWRHLTAIKKRNEIGSDLQSGSDGIIKGKAAKVPDFLSRLRGKVDIKGINKENGDRFWQYRRAVLLRGLLERRARGLFVEVMHKDLENDEKANLKHDMFCRRLGKSTSDNVKLHKLSANKGVLNAFLQTREYRYGARSLEAIIEMSRLTGQRGFERSSLPSLEQLQLHVNPEEFIKSFVDPEKSNT